MQNRVNPKEALDEIIKDNLITNQKEELRRALPLFSEEDDIATALLKSRLIPQAEYVLLHYAHTRKIRDAESFFALGNIVRHTEILERKIKTACMYPLILLGELFVILSIGIFWFAPQMHALVTKIGVSVPPILYALNQFRTSILSFFFAYSFYRFESVHLRHHYI